MKNKLENIMVTLLVLGLVFSAFPFVPPAKAEEPPEVKVKVILPNGTQYQEFGDGVVDVRGTEFTIAVVVEDTNLTTDLNLYGVSLKLRYNKTYLAYVSHTTTIPVESFPNPIAPSPYPGILYKDVLKVKDEHDPALGQISIDYASMAPAPSFNGSGTVLVATFRIIEQPWSPEYVDCLMEIYSCDLAEKPPPPPNPPPPPIPHEKLHGTVRIMGRAFSYPPLPLLDILINGNKELEGTAVGQTFVVDVYLRGSSDLDSLWDPVGFDQYLWFDPTIIEGLSLTIDPDNWVASFFSAGIVKIKEEINNAEGYVRVAFFGLGSHAPLWGQGRLYTITFNVTFESETYPPPSTTFTLLNPTSRPDHSDHLPYWGPDKFPTDMAGFAHPERPWCPWHNYPWSVPLPHLVSTARFKAPFKPPGRWLDIYTQYPDGFNGKGPNQPSDMYWPQKEVILFGYASYNLWPEQQKDVAFQVIDPHGQVYTVLCNRTNADGIATVSFRLPWMCDNPEYYFGEWTVIATVDIACQVVNDTLTFKYDYQVHIWKVTTDKPDYAHNEDIIVTIEYGSCAMQKYDILFAVTGLDETGVPFDFDKVWVVVGGAEYCTYNNGTITVTLHIPKWARAGKGTIEVNALDNWPDVGGSQMFPVVRIPVGIRAE